MGRRTILGVASTVALAGALQIVGSPGAHAASPAASCSITGGGVGQHSLSVRCPAAALPAGTRHWRIVVRFCTTSNCGWFGGSTAVPGGTSTARNNGGYVNGAPDGGPDFYLNSSYT